MRRVWGREKNKYFRIRAALRQKVMAIKRAWITAFMALIVMAAGLGISADRADARDIPTSYPVAGGQLWFKAPVGGFNEVAFIYTSGNGSVALARFDSTGENLLNNTSFAVPATGTFRFIGIVFNVGDWVRVNFDASLNVTSIRVRLNGGTATNITSIFRYSGDVLPVPAGLNATARDSQVEITWSSVSGATGYKVYRNGVYLQTVTGTTYTDNDVTNGTAYTYRVSAIDATRESTQSTHVTATPVVPPDTTPPAVPTGLSGTPGDSTIALSWTANADIDLAGYRLYRGGVPLNASSLITGTAYTDTGLTNGQAYSYRLTAVDTSGNESAPSAPYVGTPVAPPDTTPPAVPTGLGGTPGNGSIALSWQASTDSDLAGYRLYRGGVLLNPSSLITATTYNDEGLTNGQAYNYRLTAVDTSGNESEPSAAYMGTPIGPAVVPINLQGYPSNGKVMLSWGDVLSASEYRLYRDGTLLVTLPESYYVDAEVSLGQQYTYYVTAVIDGVEEDPSQTISVKVTEQLGFDGTSIPNLLDVFKSSISFLNMYSPYLVFLMALIMVVALVSFIVWLFTPPKSKKKKGKRAAKAATSGRRATKPQMSDEERKDRARGRRLDPDGDAAERIMERLTKQGRTKESEAISKRYIDHMAAWDKKAKAYNQSGYTSKRRPELWDRLHTEYWTGIARISRDVRQQYEPARKSRTSRSGRGSRNGRK